MNFVPRRNLSADGILRRPASFEINSINGKYDSTEGLFLNSATDFSMSNLMRGLSFEDSVGSRASPTPSVGLMSSYDAERWVAVGGRSISVDSNDHEDAAPNIKRVLSSLQQRLLLTQQHPPTPAPTPTPPTRRPLPTAFTTTTNSATTHHTLLPTNAQVAAASDHHGDHGDHGHAATAPSLSAANSLANALLFAGGSDSDDEDDEDAVPRHLLGHEIVPQALLALDFESTFFGCYWRNRNNNVCGFPRIGSVVANTMDYQTWQHEQKGTKDGGPTGNHDAVRIAIQLNRTKYNPTQISVVARMSCLTDLPSSDAHLLNLVLTEKEIFASSACSEDAAAPAAAAAAAATNNPVIASMEDISACQHVDAPNSFTVALCPRSWKYAAKGSRLSRKENWTFKPITNKLQAATFASGVVVLFQVLVYAKESSDQYRCVGVVRSSGFIVGSTRHLRRIAGTESKNNKRDKVSGGNGTPRGKKKKKKEMNI